MENELEKGDVLLTYNKVNFISKLIQDVTNGPSHAMVYVGDGKVAEASVGGVQISKLSKYTHSSHYEIEVLRYNKMTNYIFMSIYEYYILNKHKRYAYLQLFIDFLFIKLHLKPRRIYDIKNAFVCSEFVAKAFRYAGVKLFKESEYGIVSPKMIEDLIGKSFRKISWSKR